MNILRPYVAQDYAACLALFDSNVPQFFDRSERAAFEHFLQHETSAWHYLVIVRAGAIVACGGHALSADGHVASFGWGMVDCRLHRQGLGRALTEARLDACRRSPGLARIELDTSQHTQAFYARFGFTVERVVADGYGPGLERWDMALDLDSARDH
ncbi:GNAT family N-acetyltransferase [Xanthomonas indica]|uniref:GNAT family N-acetyltransferase n=1 Tax=Xanthomonas indica TaxID=2912242 RepID=A0AAU8IB43_9XANT|nr:GNAT family N-acetyltransferase [Xanthomonas indica]MCI2260895.1 GNAT family N-acetyltransferase [Xanthomonas indica]